jgi:hypothetical protein
MTTDTIETPTDDPTPDTPSALGTHLRQAAAGSLRFALASSLAGVVGLVVWTLVALVVENTLVYAAGTAAIFTGVVFLVGAAIGVLATVARFVVRFAGPSVWIVVIATGLCTLASWWLFGDWVEGSWEVTKKAAGLITAFGPAHGGGHPILLVIVLPILLFTSLPALMALTWTLFLAACVLALGVSAGLCLGLPPTLVLVGLRLHRIHQQGPLVAGPVG